MVQLTELFVAVMVYRYVTLTTEVAELDKISLTPPVPLPELLLFMLGRAGLLQLNVVVTPVTSVAGE